MAKFLQRKFPSLLPVHALQSHDAAGQYLPLHCHFHCHLQHYRSRQRRKAHHCEKWGLVSSFSFCFVTSNVPSHLIHVTGLCNEHYVQVRLAEKVIPVASNSASFSPAVFLEKNLLGCLLSVKSQYLSKFMLCVEDQGLNIIRRQLCIIAISETKVHKKRYYVRGWRRRRM